MQGLLTGLYPDILNYIAQNHAIYSTVFCLKFVNKSCNQVAKNFVYPWVTTKISFLIETESEHYHNFYENLNEKYRLYFPKDYIDKDVHIPGYDRLMELVKLNKCELETRLNSEEAKLGDLYSATLKGKTELASYLGHLDTIKLEISNAGPRCVTGYPDAASRCGHTHVLDYLSGKHSLDEHIGLAAVLSGQLKVLMWVKKNNVPSHPNRQLLKMCSHQDHIAEWLKNNP